MCVCVVITFSKLGINWESCLWSADTRKTECSLAMFEPKSLVSRVGFCRPVWRQPAYSPHPGWIWCLRTGLTSPFPLSATVSIRTAMRHRASPEFTRPRTCVTNGVHYREPARASSSQGSSVNGSFLLSKVTPWTVNVCPSFPTPTAGTVGMYFKGGEMVRVE